MGRFLLYDILILTKVLISLTMYFNNTFRPINANNIVISNAQEIVLNIKNPFLDSIMQESMNDELSWL